MLAEKWIWKGNAGSFQFCKCGIFSDQIVGVENELLSMLYITRKDQQEVIEEEYSGLP